MFDLIFFSFNDFLCLLQGLLERSYSPVTLHFTLKPRSHAGLDFRLVLASPTKPRLSRSLSESPEAPTLLCRRQTDGRVRKDRSSIPKTQQSSFRLIWKDLMTAKWRERGDGSERRRENQSIIKMYWRESWRLGVLFKCRRLAQRFKTWHLV